MAAKWQTTRLIFSPFIRILIVIFWISSDANRCRREALKVPHALYVEANSHHLLKRTVHTIEYCVRLNKASVLAKNT